MTPVGRQVVFVDTSVLCNMLAIPEKDQDRERVVADLERLGRSADLLLPITAVIETGNHVAQIKDGRVRRTCAEKFARMVRLVVDHKAPWTLNAVGWDKGFLESLLAGAGTGTSLVEHAACRLGCGDLSILVEMDRYRARTAGLEVSLWTFDAQLDAWANRAI